LDKFGGVYFVFVERKRLNDLLTDKTPGQCNFSTRNAWQSLAYSPLGAAVSPPRR